MHTFEREYENLLCVFDTFQFMGFFFNFLVISRSISQFLDTKYEYEILRFLHTNLIFIYKFTYLIE